MSEPTILEDYLELVTYGFTNPMPDADEGPWKITAKDVIGGEINFNTARKTTQEAYDTKLTKKSRPKIGDVLLTKDGTLGRLAIVQQEGLCINQSVAVLRPNQKILPEYLFYLLSTPDYQRQMIGDSDGTVIKHIYITRVGKMEVDIPSIEVQKARLKHLISLDGKIKNNRQTNQTLEHIAQALFKCWFVDFEPTRAKIIAKEKGANTAIQELAAQAIICGAMTLEKLEAITQNLETTLQQAINEKLSQANQTPINTEQLKTTAALFPNALVDSELGEIPEGWNAGQLSDIAMFTSNRISVEELSVETYISTENMLENKAGIRNAASLPSAATVIKFEPLHILVSNIRPYFKKIWLSNFNGGRSADVLGFESKHQGTSEFLYNLLYQDQFFDYMMLTSKGAKMPRGDKDAIMQFAIAVPPVELMKYFSQRVEAFYNLINMNRSGGRSLSELRDTLLPKLLSGELNVSSD